MNLIKSENIKQAALEFRKLLEEEIKSIESFEFEFFPLGSCSASSMLLSSFLKKRGFGVFKLVLSKRNEKTHAWLQNDSLYIDVTADQFEDNKEKVIVEKKENSLFHMGFQITSTRDVDMKDFYEKQLFDLERIINLKSKLF
ncbi:hypothetical protein [Tenacibaculum finnmarkense]|uniref:hypothetical protein n=1 Tax=Tenacibaculum finnmarkense TaxID=2781243 RepID=UPI00187B6951|nr:hypothetical protein [Tenacibaculum finnmarkense]MBE7660467.1 hypothetical protein [Tenacibaculum finnmarkense genomovar finnmarkense]MCG8252084.1 hypothetical protein [Tenacibaculum finnmarkense genomovar finnmarkense]MCG8815613.1 hypothetical protein [Tenacibaculum finnmarkense]MCG8820707.1 hypothetical protein [Tenacibaculum finnmarkense]